MDIGQADSTEALSNTEPLSTPSGAQTARQVADLGKYREVNDSSAPALEMSNKVSPKRSPGANRNLSTPRKKLQGAAADFSLQIRQQPPRHLFSGQHFELEYELEINPRAQNSPPNRIDISITLESPRGCKEDEISIAPVEEPHLSSTRRMGMAKCAIHCSKLSKQSGAAARIRVSAKRNDSILSCVSEYVSIVNTKLQIVATGESAWRQEWYKDEGGKEKSMEIHVQAFDSSSGLVRRNIPLSLSLHYESQSLPLVSKQSILRLTSVKEDLTIRSSNGWRAEAKFRIEDVSKNHQNQNFVVQLSPSGKDNSDVAPCFTMPVRIRSKRNKKRNHVAAYPAPTTRGGQAPRRPMPTTNGPIRDFPASLSPRVKEDEPVSLRSAIENVIAWSEDVVHSLYPLQWQVIGYAQGPDGRPDFTQPYHTMPNPNQVIGSVVSSYNESTRNSLQAIRDVLNESDEKGINKGLFLNPGDGLPYNSAPQPAVMGQHLDPMSQSHTAAKGMNMDGRYTEDYGRQRAFYPRSQSVYPTSGHLLGSGEGRSLVNPLDDDHPAESQVEFVLAKQYKSASSGEHLGFPAYSESRALLGFYRESADTVAASQFVPIGSHPGFGGTEREQATRILEDALTNSSEAVHRLKDWGSIGNLIDRCLVYDFSRDMSNTS